VPDVTADLETDESILGSLALFEHLRPDEIARIARRFERLTIEAGRAHEFGDTVADLRLIVVVRGQASMTAITAGQTMHALLDPGDRYGDISLLTSHPRKVTITAEEGPVELLTLDRPALDAILEGFPIIANALAIELASELAVKNDYVRQILELHAEGFPADQLAEAIQERRVALGRRAAPVARLGTTALFSRLVVRKGAEPPFWMLVGFVIALGGARTVVALILKYKLEKQLFALVPGDDPNPMHVHHFNYGLILIGAAGLAALFPFGRRGLRALAFAFGVGSGLVFDEFALFWNLNPEYAQSLSLIACAVAAAVLVQLAYFRTFWVAVARRTFRVVRGTR
jgi:CRP-like cAMP-binding protein